MICPDSRFCVKQEARRISSNGVLEYAFLCNCRNRVTLQDSRADLDLVTFGCLQLASSGANAETSSPQKLSAGSLRSDFQIGEPTVCCWHKLYGYSRH